MGNKGQAAHCGESTSSGRKTRKIRMSSQLANEDPRTYLSIVAFKLAANRGCAENEL